MVKYKYMKCTILTMFMSHVRVCAFWMSYFIITVTFVHVYTQRRAADYGVFLCGCPKGGRGTRVFLSIPRGV